MRVILSAAAGGGSAPVALVLAIGQAVAVLACIVGATVIAVRGRHRRMVLWLIWAAVAIAVL